MPILAWLRFRRGGREEQSQPTPSGLSEEVRADLKSSIEAMSELPPIHHDHIYTVAAASLAVRDLSALTRAIMQLDVPGITKRHAGGISRRLATESLPWETANSNCRSVSSTWSGATAGRPARAAIPPPRTCAAMKPMLPPTGRNTPSKKASRSKDGLRTLGSILGANVDRDQSYPASFSRIFGSHGAHPTRSIVGSTAVH